MIFPVYRSESCCSVSPCTGFAGLATTAMASRATMNLTGVMPFFFACAISSADISREALAIWIVPLIREAIPVPEPPPVTEMRTCGFSAM